MAAPQPPQAATAPPPAPPPPPPPPAKREILIISHCGLFYWWPVWLVGFVMWIISMFSGQLLATVPSGTTSIRDGAVVVVEGKKGQPKEETKVDILQLPPGHPHLPDDPNHPAQALQPHLHISSNKNLGVVFVAILLLVIGITNVPLRGLWSVIAIGAILLAIVLLAFFEFWNTVLGWVSILDIRITAGGYLAISITLFVLWLLVMILFDRQTYMVFTPGMVRVRQEIGDAEITFDTTGITLEKQRSDLFRHWILGLGSGDLIVRTAGANSREIYMPNVLFVGRKVADIEQMLRERPVVMGR